MLLTDGVWFIVDCAGKFGGICMFVEDCSLLVTWTKAFFGIRP